MIKNDNGPIWGSNNLNDVHSNPDKADKVRAMFDDVAGKYDLANRIISLNMDKRWRKQAIKLANVKKDDKVLDLCCGTGDMVFEFARQCNNANITGLDFSENMLEQAKIKQSIINSGRYKGRNIKWLCGDASKLALADNHFDIASCAFGLRNLQEPQKAVSEIARVLKPNGKVIILEFGIPKNFLLSMVVKCYLKVILPALGKLSSGSSSGAYDYFPKSIAEFGTLNVLKNALAKAGFEKIEVQLMCFQTVLLISANKKP